MSRRGKKSRSDWADITVVHLSIETDGEECVVNTALNEELPEEMLTIALESLLEDFMHEDRYRECMMYALEMYRDMRTHGIETTRQKKVMS